MAKAPTSEQTATAQGISVKSVLLHSAAAFPLPSERTLSQAKTKGIKMQWGTQGLFWTYQGKSGLIPAPAVQQVFFSEIETKDNDA